MTTPAGSPLTLSDTTFQLLSELIHRRTGMLFDSSRRDILEYKLVSLVLDRGMDDFLDYYYLLKYDEEADVEWGRVHTALAVSETFFWREADQLEHVARHLVPQWTAARHQPSTLRFWHAGCCTGEEPYSMAMALLEAGTVCRQGYEILGTDANAVAVATAQKAVYRERSFRNLPEPFKLRYFQPDQTSLRLKDEVRQNVHFAVQNLLDRPSMAGLGRFHFIFCRNVFIYLSKAAIEQVAASLYDALEPGGYLFLASSESLLRYNTRFEFAELGGTIGYYKPTR